MPIYFLIFVSVFFLGSGFYLARRLVPKSTNLIHKIGGWGFLIILSASFPAYFVTRIIRTDTMMPLLPSVITYSMGFFSLLLTFTLSRDIVWLIFKKGPWQQRISPARRDFLRNSTRLGVLGVTSAVFGKAAHNALANPTIHHVNIAIRDLPTEIEGFSIAQISDIHVGQLINQTEYLEQIVQSVNACNANIIAITGDVVDGFVTQLAGDVAPLAQLKSQQGIFFVTGNHEYYSGALEWIEHFKTLGWVVLENAHHVLEINNQKIVIAGVHDLKANTHIPTHQCNPAQALTNAPQDSACTLLLAHHPNTAKLTDGLNIDLQLSGHTHAGQYFPATWIVNWVHPYIQGLNHRNDMQIYVNSGTGYWGPALRTSDIVGEITLLRLTRT